MASAKSWYEDLFEGDGYMRFWLGGEDAPRIRPERTLREVEFIVGKLALPQGARLLDLCCGDGRHAIELARRGYRVTGLDLASRQIEMARRAAAQAGVEVEWLRGDMRKIPERLDGQFDAAINMFTAFGYFEEEAENQGVLDAVARSLNRHGRFLIDLPNYSGRLRSFQPLHWEEMSDAIVLSARWFDFRRGRSNERKTAIEPDGSRSETYVSVRIYTLVELAAMLRRAGLEVRETWGDFDGSELGMDSRRMIVLSEKTG